MDAPRLVNVALGCCGIKLRNMGGQVIDEAYINEESSLNPFAPDYNPYLEQGTEDTYYVPEYFDPENPMPPRYHSEDSVIPSFTGMDLFLGLRDNGDDTYTNFNFTPSQIIAYVGNQLWQPITINVTTTTDTVTSDYLKGDLFEMLSVDALQQDWAANGIVHDDVAGTLTFPYDLEGTVLTPVKVSFQYKNLP